MRSVLVLAFSALAFLYAGCGDVGIVRPEGSERMILFMAMDPDEPYQALLVWAATPGDTLPGLEAEVRGGGGELLATARSPEPWTNDSLRPCQRRYGGLAGPTRHHCLPLTFDADPGAVYHIAVRAEGYAPASATVPIPGGFDIIGAQADGEPPGREGLQAAWSASEGAFRYMVGLRADVPPWCALNETGDLCGVAPDRQGWLTILADTVLDTTVDTEELEGGEGPWYFEVYATDEPLHGFLTTGHAGDLFPVPPKQNVEGGYGAVGSWVRRSVEIAP